MQHLLVQVQTQIDGRHAIIKQWGWYIWEFTFDAYPLHCYCCICITFNYSTVQTCTFLMIPYITLIARNTWPKFDCSCTFAQRYLMLVGSSCVLFLMFVCFLYVSLPHLSTCSAVSSSILHNGHNGHNGCSSSFLWFFFRSYMCSLILMASSTISPLHCSIYFFTSPFIIFNCSWFCFLSHCTPQFFLYIIPLDLLLD